MNISNETIQNQSSFNQTYSPTNWSILNHVSLDRVYRLLANKLSADELNRAGHLLTAYWFVYRADRLQLRTGPGRRCSQPTEAQLQRMVTCLETQGITGYTPESMLRELEALARHLR